VEVFFVERGNGIIQQVQDSSVESKEDPEGGLVIGAPLVFMLVMGYLAEVEPPVVTYRA